VTGYSVKVDRGDVEEALSLLEFVGGNASDAVRVGINKAGPKIRTKASSEIRSQVRLKASYVKDRLKLTKASRRKLEGRISTPSRGLLLSRFSTDANISGDKVSWIKPPPEPARGIKVKVKPAGPIKTMSNDWFYLVLRGSGRVGIARRRPKGQLGPRGGKFDVAYGPSLSQVFTDVKDDILPEAGEIYQEQVLDAVRFLLQKKTPR